MSSSWTEQLCAVPRIINGGKAVSCTVLPHRTPNSSGPGSIDSYSGPGKVEQKMWALLQTLRRRDGIAPPEMLRYCQGIRVKSLSKGTSRMLPCSHVDSEGCGSRSLSRTAGRSGLAETGGKRKDQLPIM